MPSVVAAAAVVKSEAAEDAIGSTADISQPHPPSGEVDSLPASGSSDEVVVVSDLTPSDDDFDHGDHLPVEADKDELKKKIIRQANWFFFNMLWRFSVAVKL